MPIPVVCVCGKSYPLRDPRLRGQVLEGPEQVRCPACGKALNVPLDDVVPVRPGPRLSDPSSITGRRHSPRPSEDPDPQPRSSYALPLVLGSLFFFLAVGLTVVLLVLNTPSPADDPEATRAETPLTSPEAQVPNVPAPAPHPSSLSPHPSSPIPAPPPLPRSLANLIALLRDSDPDKVSDAVRQLGPRGTEARAAIPALLQAFPECNNTLRKEILLALGNIGTTQRKDAALLLPLLADSSNRSAQQYALSCLTMHGPEAGKLALVPLTDLLRDGDAPAELRRKVVVFLGQIGPSARERAFIGLLDLLPEGAAPDELRQAALTTLDQLGPPNKSEVPTLQGRLKDGTPLVRRFAIASLTTLADEATDAVPALLELLQREKTAELRRLVLTALVEIQPRGKGVIEACNRAIDDTDLIISRQAVAALSRVGPEGGALPGLLRALQHEDAEVSKVADLALAEGALTKGQAPTVTAVLAKTVTKQVQVRLLDLLTRLGPDAVSSLPTLRNLLKDSTGEQRLSVIKAVAALGPAGKEAGTDLAALLLENNHLVKLEAAVALAQVEAPQVEQAVPFLVRSLRLENEDAEARTLRNRSGEVLIKIGRPAVTRLIDFLEDEFASGNLTTLQGQRNADARLATVQVLGAIGSKSKAPEVLLVLARVEGRDRVPEIRAAARTARLEAQKAKDK